MRTDKTIRKSSLVKDKYSIIIDKDGVHTADKQGNRYFRGRLQSKISMTQYNFEQAKNFWAKQSVNGKPLNLMEVRIKTAANSVIPYNSPTQPIMAPKIAARDESNRVIWYNVKFENGETGWICNKFYFRITEIAQMAAADTIHQIYNDKKVIACIRTIMERQK